MTAAHETAEKIRRIGLFDIPDSLAGLLAATAKFLEQHQLKDVGGFEPRFEPNRGWRAVLDLRPGDFLRVTDGYPVPLALTVDPDGDGATLRLTATLRASDLRTSIPLEAFEVFTERGEIHLRRKG